jgi:hypothetical protein
MKRFFRRSPSPPKTNGSATAHEANGKAPEETANMASAYKVPFLDAIKIRRSILTTSKESPISDHRISMIVAHSIKHAPSPFSVDSARAVCLFGADHDKLWDIALEACAANLPPPVWQVFEPRLKEFKGAYCTVSIANPSVPCSIPNLFADPLLR